jgi:hypothetical protein
MLCRPQKANIAVHGMEEVIGPIPIGSTKNQ